MKCESEEDHLFSGFFTKRNSENAKTKSMGFKLPYRFFTSNQYIRYFVLRKDGFLEYFKSDSNKDLLKRHGRFDVKNGKISALNLADCQFKFGLKITDSSNNSIELLSANHVGLLALKNALIGVGCQWVSVGSLSRLSCDPSSSQKPTEDEDTKDDLENDLSPYNNKGKMVPDDPGEVLYSLDVDDNDEMAPKLTGLNRSDSESTRYSDGGFHDWNKEFLDSNFHGEFRHDQDPKVYKTFKGIFERFQDTATLYAKIICSELGVPWDLKTIKPIGVGGIAGGDKYIHNNIVFKFAKDVELAPGLWMYGGTSGPNDQLAAKSVQNEMRGITLCSSLVLQEGIRIPLMCMIQYKYKGFSLSASARLPIEGQATLRYGSSDGGIHVAWDEEIHTKLGKVFQKLNLKEHITGLREKPSVWGPGDLEVHRGADEKLYLLDYGRIFPPEDPAIRGVDSRAVYYDLLRPELVQKNPVPLCSDAFTSWNSDPDEAQRSCHNSEVTEVTKRIFEEIIPEFARHLEQQIDLQPEMRSIDSPNENNPLEPFLEIFCPENFHSIGLNFRHFGFLRCHSTSRKARCFLLSLCVSRVLKDHCNTEMRNVMKKVQVPSDEPFKAIAIRVLNLVTANHTSSAAFWEKGIKTMLQTKYVKCLNEEEKVNTDIRDFICTRMVVFYLIDALQLEFSKECMKDFHSRPIGFHFVKSDIKSIGAKVKSLHYYHFAAAMHNTRKAQKSKEIGEPQSALRMFSIANQHFRLSFAQNAVCAHVKLRWSICLKEAAKLEQNSEEQQERLKKASVLLEDLLFHAEGCGAYHAKVQGLLTEVLVAYENCVEEEETKESVRRRRNELEAVDS